ncbi:RHS repeat domain-containing protein [Candidatus Amarobacter glycogenicus]|uniref:RHS repeat domain-containing protein n=1 Tax=Candidatus Amarobacter glycogenicus TaxID=3140699 RepID=UPI002A10F85A|nr:RHS repeat protein [Dehalococcoidia bacterium]
MTHGYGNLKSAESVTDWNSNSTTYSYDDAGRMTSTTLPSGTGIVSSYVDGLGLDEGNRRQLRSEPEKSDQYDVCGGATARGGGFNG